MKISVLSVIAVLLGGTLPVQSQVVFEETGIKAVFQKAREENKLVFMDCYTTWCGPCKMLAPVLEEMADEYKQVKFVKVDVDQDVDLARRYGIQSIPNVIFFKDGKAVDQLVGFAGKDGVLEKLNPLL